jgi:multidrug efflux system membrane fusion protein
MRLGIGLGGWLIAVTAAGAADLSATLHWAQRAELGTLVSGVVAAVSARPGTSVAKGQELLRLDDRGFRARVAQADAAVAQAKVRFEEAQREAERAEELYDRTVLSDHELQLARIAHEEARAALQAARARSVQANLDLERSRVVAPYPALVVQVDAAPGLVVVSDLQSTPLVVVAESGRMVARALVGVEQLSLLQPGKALQVGVRGEWFEGEITHIGLEPEQGVGENARYRLEVSIPVPDGQRLHAGEPAVIRLDGAGT